MRLINLFTASVMWQFSGLNRVYEVVGKEIPFGIEREEIMFADVSLSPSIGFFSLCGVASIFLDTKVNL